ncbi:MAG: nucleoside 2-deoxyribosyltransferase [Muribaculaceae bacterium]|nr:nucleoside 2-deoxyribosyltransferase [Muribaculaceae bacterium]
MKKKIYFAGSIRGGRVDADLYRRIIQFMQQTDTVLTEHVGSSNLILNEQGRERDAHIYDQDTAWLRQSDLLIAECTCPSLGVGYELAYAEHRGIPCHIFYDKTKAQLSAMLTGNPYFHIHPYESEEQIFAVLTQLLH